MKLIAIVAISFIVFFSCKKENIEKETENPIDQSYIVFGEYYGNCFWILEGKNPCVTMFKWNGDSLIEDMNPTYPSGKKPYEGFSPAKHLSCIDSIKKLIEQIPIELLSEKETVIGQPDATDGGAWYVEIKDKSGNRHFYLIDKFKNRIPAYLRPFVDELDETIKALKKCSIWYQCG